MEKRITARSTNGFLVTFDRKDVRGIGTKLNNGTYLDVELVGGRVIPIHPDWGRRVILKLYKDD